MTVNATAVWRVRPSGSNTNGGGYDAGISGAGTDYSQQNSAQASGTHLSGTTATVTDSTASAFTSAMVGNAMYITGGGSTTGWYFVVTYTSSSVVVLDRSPGGSVSGATWHLGGGWADFWTNTTSSGPLVPGNTIYILGGASPSYGSPDYTGTQFAAVAGNTTAGFVRFIGDPNTPSNNSYGGRPLISTGSGGGILFYTVGYFLVENLFVFCGSGSNNYTGFVYANAGSAAIINVVFDQNGYDCILVQGYDSVTIIGGEFFSSSAATSTYQSIYLRSGCNIIQNANLHDLGNGAIIVIGNTFTCTNCIIAKNKGPGILAESLSSSNQLLVSNTTIDANTGNGITIADQATLNVAVIFNNIISNHVTASTYGISVSAGTATANTAVVTFANYNVFYNNTSNYNAINAGANDTAEGTNPYVGQSTENYTLA